MANFQVELPDGRKFKVEGVANPEAAYAAIEQMTAQQGGQPQPQQGGQQQPAAAQPQQPERYVDPDASRGMFAVDRAQTLAGNAIEGTGRFIEQSAPAVGGPMAEYGRSVVEKNEADIARRGYQSTYQGSFRDQEGVADTLGWTGEKMVENAIPTLATYGGYAAAALTAPYSVPIATLIAAGTTAATVGMGIGETTDELKSKVSEDDYNPNAAVIGGTIVGLLDRFGATKALGVSKAKLLTMSIDEITAALRKAGKGKIAKNIMRGMAVEGVTEAAQENVIMGTAATQGAEYTGDEVIDRNIDSAVLGAAMGGSMTATTETVGKATRLFKDDGSIEDIDNLTREHQQSAATFARRIDKIATGGDLNGNTFDLQDIDKMSQTGARAVVEAAHTDLVGEIADKAGDLKELLRKSDQDTFDQRFKKVRAAVAQKMARNKTKSVVTAENFLALQDLVGGYTEGQALMNLIRESQIMTEVHNNDYQGKLSKFTDMFAIAGGGSGYDKSAVAVERVVRPIGSLAFGMNSYGLSLLGQQAVASIGKRLDKARGTYSSVDKFIKENKDKAGLPAPRPPSFRDQRLQQAQQASSKRAGLQAYNDQRDGGDNSESPVGKILAGTGLSPDGLNKLLDYIETAPDATPDVMAYLDQTRRNLAGEGNRIDDISPWIQAINGTLNESEELDALREDQPDNPLAQRARRRAGFGPSAAQQQQTQGPSAAVQSGIDDNRAQLEKLRQGLAANTSLTPAERGRLLTALDTLEYNLGSDPAVAAMDVVSRLKSDGISESLINRHIMPYVERVLRQQARSGRRQQPPSTGGTDLAFDEDFDASKPALTDNVPTGAVSGVPLETYLPRAYDIAKREVYKKGRDLKLALQSASLRSQKSNKLNLREFTPENIDRLADFAVADALEAIKTNSNAIGWYDKTVTEALDQMGQVFPEIKSDGAKKLQFIWALAATSNGLKVDKNLALAGEAYEYLQTTGRFPTNIGIGESAAAINSGLAMYHQMLDFHDGDHNALEAFANSQMLVKDLQKKYSVKISGEGANEMVRGAAVIGPKIGNGFFSNLYGNFDALTIDRWNMRTVGRWRGNLVVLNKKMIKQKRDEMWSTLSALDKDQIARLKKLYKGTRTKLSNTAMSDAAIDKLAVATAKLSMNPKWRVLINKEFEAVRLIGNGLYKYNDGQVEAPSGPTERSHIRRIFEQALDRLNNDAKVRALPAAAGKEQPLTMADLQALLWYPEKLLYDTAKKPIGEESKGYKDDEAPDYANAARKYVSGRNRYANSQRGGLGSVGSDGRRGRGTGTPIDGPNGQPIGILQSQQGQDASRQRGVLSQSNDRGQGQGTSATLEELEVLREGKSPEALAAFVAKDGWSILTATQEAIGDHDHPQNIAANEDLLSHLEETGVPFIEVTGMYLGTPQGKSFLILSNEDAAVGLGKRFNQDSVLTVRGFVYSDPSTPITPSTGVISAGPEALKEENYTDVAGQPFAMGLDFGSDSLDQDAGALTQQPVQQPQQQPQQPQQQSPFNMKALVNKMLGSQPATPDQVKAQLPEVRALFEIGKAGTRYADGIQDIESAVEFAKAINITLKLFDSQQEMFDHLGVDVKDGVRGLYRKRGRTAYGLREGAQVSDQIGKVTSLDSLTTAIHELSHGLAFDSGFESLFDNFGGISAAKRRQIDNEIDNIQKYADLYIEKNPSQRRKVRRVMDALNAQRDFDDADTQARTGRYLDYVRSPEERAVDPVLLYLLNPKVAKNIAPATSALVKEMMNKSTDKFQLYTYPFATMVAVVLAMMLNGRAEEEEEEKQRQQMPAGALSPQAGALSPQQAA